MRSAPPTLTPPTATSPTVCNGRRDFVDACPKKLARPHEPRAYLVADGANEESCVRTDEASACMARARIAPPHDLGEELASYP